MVFLQQSYLSINLFSYMIKNNQGIQKPSISIKIWHFIDKIMGISSGAV